MTPNPIILNHHYRPDNQAGLADTNRVYASDSAYVDLVCHGYVEETVEIPCPAYSLWYMLFLKHGDTTTLTVHGPTTQPCVIRYSRGDEYLGIRFRLGVFMPALPPTSFVNQTVDLSGAIRKTAWLRGTAWPVPTFETADLFAEQLVQAGILDYDPVVSATLEGNSHNLTLRSVQMRFLRATGLPHKIIQQVERARYAASLLQHGCAISDAVFTAGYCDQPHMTRSLKRFFGYTPAQIASVYSLK